MRLLLVEDNEELSQLLEVGLAKVGFTTEVVQTASDADAAVRSVRFSAIVLDLGLPDGDGLDVLRALRGRGDPTPVLILTARSGVKDRVTGLQEGADDYLVKPFSTEELVARLKALLRRPGQLLGRSLSVGDVTLDTEARQVFVGQKPFPFAPREIAILEMLMRRGGLVVAKKVIEDQLYGLSGEIGSNAIEVYVSRLRRQLSSVGAKVQIHTIHGVGYLIKGA